MLRKCGSNQGGFLEEEALSWVFRIRRVWVRMHLQTPASVTSLLGAPHPQVHVAWRNLQAPFPFRVLHTRPQAPDGGGA